MVSFSNIEFTGSINTVNPGGVIFMNNASSSLTITNCAFVNNSTAGISKPGGAVSVNSGDLDITNSRFVDNQAEGNGGAVNMLGSGNLTVTNSLFSGNIASNPTISPVKNGSGGGLIVGGSVTTTISSNTFYNNTDNPISRIF